MFFYASKIFWFLVGPLNLTFLLVLIGGLLLWTRWFRLGRGLIVGALLIIGFVSVVPLGPWLVVSLEDRFVPPTGLEAVDGIIVLGGVISGPLSEARGQVALGSAAERLTVLPGLAQRYPEATIVFTGGSGDPFDQSRKEADYLRPLLVSMGMDPGRVILENQSRNTWENATRTREKVQPGEGSKWLLVTSAIHMPRAMGCFRQAGWSVIAYPVDYGTRGGEDIAPSWNPGIGFGALSAGLHEWLGLLFYYLTDRTNALFPA
ncbi:YdcF family protein [Magnetospira sp. QH-2]|uniref:YdcF family protein n=1 Tax=Magnetospira sp. (strain QH-2) TaxID=1288970 RepID=UPI0003E80D08|nr:YdcF family protein [Magnetospira sp. QH-2]CCQ73779.1 Conserved protein of unknown function [Magnetospira sp. QH-2]